MATIKQRLMRAGVEDTISSITWHGFVSRISGLSANQKQNLLNAYKTQSAEVLGRTLIDSVNTAIKGEVEPAIDSKIAKGSLNIADIDRIINGANT